MELLEQIKNINIKTESLKAEIEKLGKEKALLMKAMSKKKGTPVLYPVEGLWVADTTEKLYYNIKKKTTETQAVKMGMLTKRGMVYDEHDGWWVMVSKNGTLERTFRWSEGQEKLVYA